MTGRVVYGVLLLTAFAGAVLSPGDRVLAADVPNGINYQGKLTNASGQIVPDGSYEMTFKLYPSVSDPTAFWTMGPTSVSTIAGVFTVALTPLSASDLDKSEVWLEVKVGSDDPLGRVQLRSAPYALVAQSVPDASLTSAKIASGQVVRSLNGLKDDVTLAAGSNVTITSGGNTVTISASGGGDGWGLTGNSGTTPGTSFLGTTDDNALEIKVNSQRALRIEPNAACSNMVGGWSGNAATSGVNGATIAGGGQSGLSNTITDDYGTIGGGSYNVAGNSGGTTSDAAHSTVAGGIANVAANYVSSVGGGYGNTAAGQASAIAGGWHSWAAGDYSFIGGGYINATSGFASVLGGGYTNYSIATASTVGGGGENAAGAQFATIGGGRNNYATGEYSTIAGGGPSDVNYPGTTCNRATDDYCSIGGGGKNQAGNANGDTTDRSYATVAGGMANNATGKYSAILGGRNNTAGGETSAISGGATNSVSARCAYVGGGESNVASGQWATVCGGYGNIASGSYSFAAGNMADTNYFTGAFVWGDMSTLTAVQAERNNQFRVRAGGGAKFNVNSTGTLTTDWVDIRNDSSRLINTSTTAYLSTGGEWTNASSKFLKANFAAVNPREVLDKLSAVPISTWNYKAEDPKTRHIGPMAQDFAAAFKVGADDEHIGTIDADGVALAAIQGLYQENQELKARVAALEKAVAALAEGK